MESATSGEWGYRVGGLSALVAGVLRLSIVVAFTVTGLGAAGDRAYGSFSGFTFVPSAALVLASVGLLVAFADRMTPVGRRGLHSVVLGLTVVTVGQFGGEWLAFPRSGNVLILPGTLVMMVGLTIFSRSAWKAGLPGPYWIIALLIALLPFVFFPLAMAFDFVFIGGTFPPSLHDNYFTVLYVLESSLWLALGITLLRGPTGVAASAGSA